MTVLRFRVYWLAIGWLGLAAFALAALSPWGRIETQLIHHDKFAHALSFLLLTSWFCAIYTSMRPRVSLSFGLALFGVIIEYFQFWSGQRVFSLGDIAANLAGIAIALVFVGGRLGRVLKYVEERIPSQTTGRWRH